MQRNILGILAVIAVSTTAVAEVKPVGTIVSEFCGKVTELGQADEACITREQLTAGAKPEAVRYVTLAKKDVLNFLRLSPEKIRVARPQGCTGYELTGVTNDGNYNIHTDGTALFCDNAHILDKKATLQITLQQGRTSLKQTVEVERQLVTK